VGLNGSAAFVFHRVYRKHRFWNKCNL